MGTNNKYKVGVLPIWLQVEIHFETYRLMIFLSMFKDVYTSCVCSYEFHLNIKL